jgi:hypothetical protein
MKVYRFDSLKNNFDAGLELLHSRSTATAIFEPPIENDAAALEIANAILNAGNVDMVRVTEVIDEHSERLVQEVYA